MEEKESLNSTFIVEVKCMENDTWQGKITWAEKNRGQDFRSAMELLKLMDRALTEGNFHLEEDEEGKEE